MLQFLATPTPSPATLATLVTSLSDGFGTVLTAVTSACTTIVNTPFLLLTCVFLFAGGVVGIIGRLLSRN